MNSVWIRGPICGTDNCRSRLWRSIAGRKICQYGHVREGDYEYNDDDDENYVQTRRLNVPTLSNSGGTQHSQRLEQKKTDEQLFGIKGQQFFLRNYQIILSKQCEWLINEKKFPLEFENVLKKLWVIYLSQNLIIKDNHSDNNNNNQQDEDEDEDEEIISSDVQISNQEGEYDYSKLPLLIDSLVLCYFACAQLKLPIYISDFIKWCSVNKLPYLKSSSLLPPGNKKKLANYYLRGLEPLKPPMNGELYYSVLKNLKKFNKNRKDFINFDYELNYQPLLFKICKELILPMEIAIMVNNAIFLQDINLNLSNFFNYNKKDKFAVKISLVNIPELKVVALLVSCAKLYFTINSSLLPSWYGVMNSLQNDINSSNNNGDNDVFLSSLIYQQSSYNSLLNWNDFKTDNYLKWCEMNLLSNENDEINHNNKSLAKKRLFDIFQLQDQKSNTNENIINTTNEKVETRNSTQTYYQRLFTTTHTSSSTTLSIKDLNNLENFLMNNLTTNLGISIDQFKVLVKWSDSLLKRIAKEPSPTI